MKSRPESIVKILKIINDDEFHMDDLVRVISSDLNLKLKLLKFINSATFGISKKVTDLKQSVEYLGVKNIIAIIKYVEVFSIFENHSKLDSKFSKAVDCLRDKEIIDYSISMAIKMILNIKSIVANKNTDEVNKTSALILFLMMVEEEICDALKSYQYPSPQHTPINPTSL